jgi:hypothetical protein
MSFLPAVHRQINNRQPNDPVRIVLEFLVQRAVGHNHAVPLRDIVAHLNGRGINITETGFQQTLLAESRGADYFIGSGHRGFYLIDTIGDAEEMRDFYEHRIRTETDNLLNLRRQATSVGWKI